jgi:hypothetical protein
VSDDPALPRWNWGAFLLGWLWAFLHRLWWQGVLGLIPGLNIAMMPVFGLKGNEWAWERGNWSSVEAFRSDQRGWAIAGAAVWALGAVAIVSSLAF